MPPDDQVAFAMEGAFKDDLRVKMCFFIPRKGGDSGLLGRSGLSQALI